MIHHAVAGDNRSFVGIFSGKKGAALERPLETSLQQDQLDGGLKPPLQVLGPLIENVADATRFPKLDDLNRQRPVVPVGLTVTGATVLPF